MSCPKCGDDTWWLHDRVFKAQETAINFCPFCGANLAAPPLKWTREKPTKPGHYWHFYRPDIIELVHVYSGFHGLMSFQGAEVGDGYWWFGPLPIEKPEPPKESP